MAAGWSRWLGRHGSNVRSGVLRQGVGGGTRADRRGATPRVIRDPLEGRRGTHCGHMTTALSSMSSRIWSGFDSWRRRAEAVRRSQYNTPCEMFLGILRSCSVRFPQLSPSSQYAVRCTRGRARRSKEHTRNVGINDVDLVMCTTSCHESAR